MANTISGKIMVIGQIESIPYQGNVFNKRELVLDASHYDPMTGDKFENYPRLEFTGKHVNDLDGFQVGQLVTVSFALSGRRNEKNGIVSYFTNIQGYKVEPFQRAARPQQPQQQVAAPAPPTASPQASADMPTDNRQWQDENNLPF